MIQFMFGVLCGLLAGTGLFMLLGWALEEEQLQAPPVQDGRYVNASIHELRGWD